MDLSNTVDLNALQVTSLDARLHLSGRTRMYINEVQVITTTNREHFLERLHFFTEKTHHEAVMLYGNYGLGSFPESQLPLFLIIYYSSLFQSKMRADLWEMTYKMKHGNMGWMMINGSYDMCLQKCKGHKCPGGEGWHGVTQKGFHMSKRIKTIYFLMETLLAYGVSFEEKVRRYGGKHVVPCSCPEKSTTGKPFVLDLCEGSSWIYVLQLYASFCRYDGYLIITFLFPC